MSVRILGSLSNDDGYWYFNESGLINMKIWFYQMGWWGSNGHRERFGKLALADRWS